MFDDRFAIPMRTPENRGDKSMMLGESVELTIDKEPADNVKSATDNFFWLQPRKPIGIRRAAAGKKP